jgi:hypothetical protein
VLIFSGNYMFHKNENIPFSAGDCGKVRDYKKTRQNSTLNLSHLENKKILHQLIATE